MRVCWQASSATPNWSRELQQLKGSLADLTVGEALYLQYSSVAAEQQTVREFVCCRVYEAVERETRSREALSIELQQLTQQLVRAESEMERVRLEKEQLSRSKRLSARTKYSRRTATQPMAGGLHSLARHTALRCLRVRCAGASKSCQTR